MLAVPNKNIHQRLNAECLFCGNNITPEETGSDYDAWLFDCESCGAIYESRGKVIPRISVINRPVIREELNFDDE